MSDTASTIVSGRLCGMSCFEPSATMSRHLGRIAVEQFVEHVIAMK